MMEKEETPSGVTEVPIAGHISVETYYTQTYFWTLHNFLEQPWGVGFYVDSPACQYEDTTWFMRISLNGQSENESNGWIYIMLIRSGTRALPHRVMCLFQVCATEEISHSSCHQEDVALSQETSDAHTLTWQIPNFHELPLNPDYRVGSDQLVFENTGWYIRTYPNGRSEDESEGWICLMMKRTSTLAPTQNVLCEFGIRDNNGHDNIMAERILKKNDLELGPIKLLELAEACKFGNNFLHNGTITMVCRMKYIGDTETGQSTVCEIPSSMCYSKQMGHLSRTPAFVQKVTWKLAHFCEMPMTFNYCVVSPAFEFEGTTCSLRLYPNRKSEYEENGWICIELEMADFLPEKQPDGFLLGIKGSEQKIYEKDFLRAGQKVVGTLKLLRRSDVNKRILDGDSIRVICKIFKVLEMKAVELEASNQTEVSEIVP